jgi:hypothetical protein
MSNTLSNNQFTYIARSLDQKDREYDEKKAATTESERFSYIPPLGTFQQMPLPANMSIDQLEYLQQSMFQ